MTTVERRIEEFERLAEVWLRALDDYSEEEFRRPSERDGWSIGQVYAHVIDASMGFAVPKIERCLDPERAAATKGRSLLGRIFFLWGGFPPVRIRYTITKGYGPAQPASIDEARAALQSTIDRVRHLGRRIPSALPDRRSAHPLFGHLDPEDWLAFMVMHTRHHLRQKKRIDRGLGKPRSG